MRLLSRKRFVWASVLSAAALAVGYAVCFFADCGLAGVPWGGKKFSLEEIPFDGRQAYDYLRRLCDLGPRPSGSGTMVRQQEMLAEHFQSLGGTVSWQKFRVRHPLDGSSVPMANLVVEWQPDREERILLCAHYDTRPYPDSDKVNPRGRFVGANDGASGTALLMELGRGMAKLPGKLGVDFVLFDGEEFVFRDRDTYFFGSEHFARSYAADPPPHRYRWGVLVDMIGDADLWIYQEGHSVSWRDTRPLVTQIWDTAKRLGVREFIPRRGSDISDDHLPLRNTAKIPTCDIIDFDYPYWHTEQDTPERCSPLSLAKTGWVLREWLTGAVQK